MFGPSRERLIDDQIYNLKYMVKSLNRTAKKHKEQEKAFYKKAKNALKQGDERTAAAYVRQSQQFSNLALRTTTLACNLQVIEARVTESVQTGRMNEDILKTVSLLTSHLQPLNGINNIGYMDKAFEDVLVYTTTIANTMDDIAAPTDATSQEQQSMLAGLKEELAAEASEDFIALPSLGEGLIKNDNGVLHSSNNVTNYF